tara:strand:+ start:77 stop:436 length:360 start_codon:yes stop_codon:yes gene_type:complete
MDLTRTFAINFIYSGLLLGVLLTIIDVIKDSKRSIGLYAFLSGSFFIVNLIQYYYVNRMNDNNTNSFLIHSIIGGIFWVIFSIILYYLHKLKLDMGSVIVITSIIVIITSILYYYWMKN